ncbi:hypothetical protein, partial [Peribacillus frigoritolerans]|uniref:hypothetical protein n=1 Tax=Peribacillus frigoritolerans TaxID=450367 RepID=UPI002E1ED2E9|nr:hypothetical protein [Peribacillus frigoritolerans]
EDAFETYSIQRDQLEMITLDQLVPANHLVRKMEISKEISKGVRNFLIPNPFCLQTERQL